MAKRCIVSSSKTLIRLINAETALTLSTAPTFTIPSIRIKRQSHLPPCTCTLGSNRRYASAAAALARAPPPEAEEDNHVPSIAPPYTSLTSEDLSRLKSMRNIGISAHIDSGKTTLTERILFYTGRIKSIHEVRGKDEVGAKMDSMELEREKGITIQSAATFCDWKVREEVEQAKGEYKINIIDTPGHVDFTIEVERALRVLDGAVLVLCAVSGVQSQTTTVDRQMRRYNVPRLSFINKMDRCVSSLRSDLVSQLTPETHSAGANPFRIVKQIKEKLRIPAALVQYPIGAESSFEGVIDLVRWKTIRNSGEKGINVEETDEIPANLLEAAKAKRIELIETVADVDDTLADMYLEEMPISVSDLYNAIRRATIARAFSPVFVGTALGNTSVQALLDGVCSYLPTPNEVAPTSLLALEVSKSSTSQVQLVPATKAPLVGLAFKLEEGKFGQLTYMRVYQGRLSKGMNLVNVRTGKKLKVPKLVRMHSDEMEEVDSVSAGEICAIYGVDCASGDTFTDGTIPVSMTSMYVPEPVMSLSIRPKGQESPAFSRAINRFQREDPTFRVHVDSESGETIISGMGELHLEIYVERMKREYNMECVTGKPQVAFRETITAPTDFSYTHKKQTGGAGQFAKIIGRLEPMEYDAELGTDTLFESQLVGQNLSDDYVPAIKKGFEDGIKRGSLTSHIVTGCKFILEDGAMHSVDSSELAFRTAAMRAFQEAFLRASPVILEPIMKVEVTAPAEFQGNIIGGINSRKGVILDSDVRDVDFTLTAEISLNEMFGYASALRASTQGKGEFSMEFETYRSVLPNVQREMMEEHRKFIGKK